MTPEPCVYGYARVSTAKQTESPSTQKEIIAEFCLRRGLGAVTDYYVDKSTSGSIPLSKRAGGEALMNRLKAGDAVVVAKLDRGFRSLKDFCHTTELWRRLGVRFYITDIDMDFSCPFGTAMVQILAVFAELERKMTGNRIKEGLAYRKRHGNRHSNYAGYGFQWTEINEDGVLRKISMPHEGERAIMRQIVSWRTQPYPLPWGTIEVKLRGEVTKDNTGWSTSRIRKCFKAELRLQLKELERRKEINTRG